MGVSSVRHRHPQLRIPAAARGLAVAAGLVTTAACSSGGSGPEEVRGLLEISATDVDGVAGGIAPAGFETDEISSFHVQVNSGPRVVVDSVLPGSAVLQHAFRLRPDTYLVLVEAFQDGDVLLYTGAGQATIAGDDTVALAVDLDPSIGQGEITIDGGADATVRTNATAPVRVVVRNVRGQPVAGARVEVDVSPSTSGAVTLAGEGETGPDGTVTGTLTPARREVDGTLGLRVDGFDVGVAVEPSFTVVSPVDVGRSTLFVSNGVRLLADGLSAAEVTVRVVDAAGTPQAGIPVEIVSSRNVGTGPPVDVVTSDQTETNGAGEFRARLTTTSSSSLAGDALVTALADGKELDAEGLVTFRSQVSAGATQITVAPVTLPANGTAAADIVVEVRGAANNPLPNVFVQLQTNGLGDWRLQPESGRTDGQGIFRSRISSTTRGATFIDVIADGLRTSASGFVIFN